MEKRDGLAFFQIPASILGDTNLTPTAKLLFARLATSIKLNANSGKGAACRVSHARLAADLGMDSVSNLKARLNELRARRLIDWKRSRGACSYTLQGGHFNGYDPDPPASDGEPVKVMKIAVPAAMKSAKSEPLQRPQESRSSGCQIAVPAATGNSLVEEPLEKVSFGQSPCSSKRAYDDGVRDTPWFTNSEITVWRKRFQEARGELPSIAEAERFLQPFHSADEAEAYLANRWPAIQHSALRRVAGYCTDAQTWLKQYRQDLADGQGGLYNAEHNPYRVDLGIPKLTPIDLERAEALAAERAAREREREAAHLRVIHERASAGDVAARLVEYLVAKGADTYLEVALEGASGRVAGDELILAGVRGGDLAFAPDAVLKLLPDIGIEGVSRVRFVGRGEVAA
jgi:hypothetical protein